MNKYMILLLLLVLKYVVMLLLIHMNILKKQYLEPPGSNASWNTRDQHMLMTTMKLKIK